MSEVNRMRFQHLSIFVTAFVLIFVFQVSCEPLHILLVVVDDFGWSDVGFHGSKIHTPNMDRLAAEGVILENYYVQPICTPTRGALMSGRYPIHTGLQHSVIHHDEPYGLPLILTTLPQALKKAGYSTHIVGKWHLGFYEWPYTPTHRGFDSFYGFYTGSGDHFNHEAGGFLDLRNNTEPVTDKRGVYSARLYAEQAQNVILSHNSSSPLFLYLSFQNVHSPAQAPQEYVDKYHFIADRQRRTYAAMVDIVDEAIGNVTQAMQQADLWEDTLMIVTTDNGGDPRRGGYNWPLRGHKSSLWEAGVRGVGFVHGKMLQKTGVKCTELLHVTDWYPTLLNLTGIAENDSSLPPLDGFNIWQTISEGAPSPRTEILLNIDVPSSSGQNHFHYHQGSAIRVDDMKLLMDVPNITWYKPPELSPEHHQDFGDYTGQDHRIEVALFNITADPTEQEDLSTKLPDVVKKLQDRVQYYMRGLVPPLNKHSDPIATVVARHRGYWGPWKGSNVTDLKQLKLHLYTM